MNDITALAQRITRYGTNSQGMFTNQTDGAYVTYIDFMALVEAMESEQRICATWRKTAEANSESLAKNAEFKNSVRRESAARKKIDEQAMRITELEESHAQAIQSRDYYKRMSEEGLKQLAESRTVTVKLPMVSDDSFWLSAYGRLVFREETYRSAVVNAICYADIQVIEGEE